MLSSSIKPIASLGFHVPSRSFVQLVLVISIVVGALCLHLSLTTTEVEILSLDYWFWLPIVPLCGIPWLLLAGHCRSHSKEYYIRHRFAKLIVYSTCLFAFWFAPYGWVNHTVNPLSEIFNTSLSDNILISPLLGGIVVATIFVLIIAWNVRKIDLKEKTDEAKPSFLKEISRPLFARILPIILVSLYLGSCQYFSMEVLGMRDVRFKQQMQDRLIETKTCIRCLKLTRLRGLENVDLSGAVLTSSRLKGSNLENANLTEANLRGVDLSDVNLKGANLTGADLTNARLYGAQTKGVIFCRTTMPDGERNDSGC